MRQMMTHHQQAVQAVHLQVVKQSDSISKNSWFNLQTNQILIIPMPSTLNWDLKPCLRFMLGKIINGYNCNMWVRSPKRYQTRFETHQSAAMIEGRKLVDFSRRPIYIFLIRVRYAAHTGNCFLEVKVVKMYLMMIRLWWRRFQPVQPQVKFTIVIAINQLINRFQRKVSPIRTHSRRDHPMR